MSKETVFKITDKGNFMILFEYFRHFYQKYFFFQ